MLTGTKSLLNDSQEFLKNFILYLEYRNAGLKHGAQGASRFVSFRLGAVELENAYNAFAKIDKLKAGLPSDTWLGQRWNKFKQRFWGDANANLMQKRALKEAIGKTHKYLLAAQEALTEISYNSTASQTFLPVLPHNELAAKAEKLKATCDEILKNNANLFSHEATFARRSWLTDEMRMDSLFVATRVVKHGLTKSTTPSPGIELTAEDAKQNYGHAVAELQAIATRVEAVATTHAKPTKRTRKLMDCEKQTDRAGASSLHYDFCPTNVPEVMVAFKDFMKSMGSKAPKLEAVDKVIEVKFPKPSM